MNPGDKSHNEGFRKYTKTTGNGVYNLYARRGTAGRHNLLESITPPKVSEFSFRDDEGSRDALKESRGFNPTRVASCRPDICSPPSPVAQYLFFKNNRVVKKRRHLSLSSGEINDQKMSNFYMRYKADMEKKEAESFAFKNQSTGPISASHLINRNSNLFGPNEPITSVEKNHASERNIQNGHNSLHAQSFTTPTKLVENNIHYLKKTLTSIRNKKKTKKNNLSLNIDSFQLPNPPTFSSKLKKSYLNLDFLQPKSFLSALKVHRKGVQGAQSNNSKNQISSLLCKSKDGSILDKEFRPSIKQHAGSNTDNSLIIRNSHKCDNIKYKSDRKAEGRSSICLEKISHSNRKIYQMGSETFSKCKNTDIKNTHLISTCNQLTPKKSPQYCKAKTILFSKNLSDAMRSTRKTKETTEVFQRDKKDILEIIREYLTPQTTKELSSLSKTNTSIEQSWDSSTPNNKNSLHLLKEPQNSCKITKSRENRNSKISFESLSRRKEKIHS